MRMTYKRFHASLWFDKIVASKFEERFAKLEKKVEELEETVEILGDPKTMKDIKVALADLKAGRVKIYKDIDSYINELI